MNEFAEFVKGMDAAESGGVFAGAVVSTLVVTAVMTYLAGLTKERAIKTEMQPSRVG